MWQNLKTQRYNSKTQKIQNINCDKTQKLKVWQNSKKFIVTKLKNLSCDKTQTLKVWTISKTPMVRKKITNSNCEKKKKKILITTKLNFQQNSKKSWHLHDRWYVFRAAFCDLVMIMSAGGYAKIWTKCISCLQVLGKEVFEKDIATVWRGNDPQSTNHKPSEPWPEPWIRLRCCPQGTENWAFCTSDPGDPCHSGNWKLFWRKKNQVWSNNFHRGKWERYHKKTKPDDSENSGHSKHCPLLNQVLKIRMDFYTTGLVQWSTLS